MAGMRRSDRGFTIVEVLIASSILTAVILGFAEFMRSQGILVQGLRTLSNRDVLFNQLSRIAFDPAALAASAQSHPVVDAALLSCAVSSTPVCGNTSSAQDFTLYDLQGTQWAGPNANPQRYTIQGAPCAGPADNFCALEAVSTFTPIFACPTAMQASPPPTCSFPTTLNATQVLGTCSSNQALPGCQPYAVQIDFTIREAGASTIPGAVLRTRRASYQFNVPLSTTTGGSANYLAKWMTNSLLGSSATVYESGGMIGIGTTTPNVALTVSAAGGNTLRLNNSGASSWAYFKAGSSPDAIVGALNASGDFQVQTGSPSAGRLTVLASNGWVGIGNAAPQAVLDVSGEVKFGNTAPGVTACAAGQAGSIRYNSTAAKMEYCNGSSWAAIGGSAALNCSTYSVFSATTATASCPAGSTLVGGGFACQTVIDYVITSYPNGNAWTAGPCHTPANTYHGVTAYARCCQ